MNASQQAPAADQARLWREAFDRTFAEPAVLPDADLKDFLGIRIADQPYALALEGLAGLHPYIAPGPYPGSGGEDGLLGLIGHQGRALPLYDLRALLGQGRAVAPRWLVTLKAVPLALAFEIFEAPWRLASADRLPAAAAQAQTGPGLLGDAVRCDGVWRPTVNLAALVERLRARANT